MAGAVHNVHVNQTAKTKFSSYFTVAVRPCFKFVLRDAFKTYSKLKRLICTPSLSSILQNNLLESAGFPPVSSLLIPKGVGKYL